MAKYLVESPHTPEGCLSALDGFLAVGPEFLARFDFGCRTGEHTGWALLEAASESAARNMLPAGERIRARVVKVSKFTPEQIKAAHE